MSEWIKRLAAKYAEVNESKFLIPEEIPTAERTAFMGAAAAAHKAGQTHFNFGGKKHKVTMKTDTARAIADDVKEASDLDAKSVEKAVRHDCATHVEHAEFGKGECVPGMHTIVETSEGEGYVTHYDVLFSHGLEENVSVDDLTILAEMSHTHKKMKKEGEEVVMNPKNKKDSKETMASEAKVDEISKDKVGAYLKAVPASAASAGRASHGDEDERKKGMAKFINRRMGTKDAVAKLTGKARVPATESTIPPVYARILENRAAHYKKASKPEDWDEKEKNNKGAMDMKKDMAVDTSDKITDYDDKGHKDMEKAGRVGPSAKARPGDNKSGDKKVIPSATPVKGK